MSNNNENRLYPLLFAPIYREIMWGGDLLTKHLGRTVPKSDIPVAESWEIADRPDAVSVVENGRLAGKTIADIMRSDGKSVLGKAHREGKPFPLLVKLIDAGKRLSLQVHPDETSSAKIPGAEPKTEMWYVIAAKPQGRIFAGLKHTCTKQRFLEIIDSNNVEECLQSFKSVPEDAYFINSGTVHAIGAGNLLLEIQQNSNTTFRISDWGRLGPDGKPRDLHVKEALECVNFADRSSPHVAAESASTQRNRRLPLVNRCPFFNVVALKLVNEWIDSTETGYPHLLTAINKEIAIKGDFDDVTLDRGRTCLIPANCGNYRIGIGKAEETTVVQTTIK
ncbi:MAG: class I mannose-6-phosphate isomerase [Victivallales bacterium]|nr:class I mannose-6-phosphate isomerase [Victivallales bacterium]